MTNENLEESFRDFAIVVRNAYAPKSQVDPSSRAPSDSNSAKRKVRAKTNNQKTLSCLRDALREIERATAPRKARREFPNIPTILPKKATFDELERCIFLLARGLRKKKVFTFATATAAVAKRWTSLRLDTWLPSLLQRLPPIRITGASEPSQPLLRGFGCMACRVHGLCIRYARNLAAKFALTTASTRRAGRCVMLTSQLPANTM